MDLEDVEIVATLVAAIEKNARTAGARAAAKTHPLTWVKLERYVELSGDSVDAVQSRRRIGKWIDGKQCKIVDGRLWVNLPAVEEWSECWDAKAPALALLATSRSHLKGANKG